MRIVFLSTGCRRSVVAPAFVAAFLAPLLHFGAPFERKKITRRPLRAGGLEMPRAALLWPAVNELHFVAELHEPMSPAQMLVRRRLRQRSRAAERAGLHRMQLLDLLEGDVAHHKFSAASVE